MKTSMKIMITLCILLLFVVPFSFATDINMNLQDDDIEENTLFSNEINDDTYLDDEQNDISPTVPSTTITSSPSVSEENLGFSNILNILLIVVGVVLILLGIAILIRMHA